MPNMKSHKTNSPAKLNLDESVGPRSLVSGLQLPGWWPDLPVGQGELDLGVVELLGVHTLTESDRDGGCLDDLDARHAHAMT